MTQDQPFVSVVIPVLELSYYVIFENVPAFEHQSYRNFEVIVLPNEHGTYDLTMLKKYPWLRIIPTGKVTRPALKRDIGVKEAKGEIIAFIDDDAYPSPNWLKNAVRQFQKSGADAVCGPGLLPPSGNYWEQVFDEIMKNWVGSGGYSYRFVKGKKQSVDDYPSMNFLIKKKRFVELGGFNNDYWPGEDSKLCNDLVHKAGGRILYHPDVYIYHHRRNALLPYLRQQGSYGYHRGAFFAQGDENSRRPGYLVPSLFTAYFMTYMILLVLSLFLKIPQSTIRWAGVPLGLYLMAMLWLCFQALVNTGSLYVALGSPVTLLLTHLSYGIMFCEGYWKGLTANDKIYD